MNPPTEDERAYKFWNRLKEFMTDKNRADLLQYAERKTAIASQYLNLNAEHEQAFLRQNVKDRYIENSLIMCIKSALNEKWGGVWNKSKQCLDFPNKSRTFYIPEPTDERLLEEVVYDYKELHEKRRRKGLA
ncbi:hypothetical protein J4219_05665 [Candidatus Woesearchaeota archaeon]|nr:hypothetical protein [Candidatus Woesearchaeota archaeon]